MTCRICGRDIEPGTVLPYRHSQGLSPRTRSHYAVPASRSVPHRARRQTGTAIPVAIDAAPTGAPSVPRQPVAVSRTVDPPG